MKTILLDAYGRPDTVLRCADVDDLPAPGADEVLFDVQYFPINPADLGFCRGTYRLRPPLPATPGAECLGRVRAVGPQVTRFAPGDRVINLLRENWTQRRLVREADLVPVPDGIDDRQAAMLRINPPTARLLLTDFVSLEPEEWVLQNVANSSVGRWVRRLAGRAGLRVVNVVRRDAAIPPRDAWGDDLWLVDGADLPARVRVATDAAAIRLGIDAVGGAASIRMADCLADAGTLVCYGAMSGEAPVVSHANLLYRDVALRGFMLGNYLGRRSPAEIAALYRDLGRMLREAQLQIPVRQVYPITAIRDAVAHAMQGERDGKILVAPNDA